MNEKANSKKIVSQAGELFLNSLEASDVCNFQKAIMEYPTWACFVNLIMNIVKVSKARRLTPCEQGLFEL